MMKMTAIRISLAETNYLQSALYDAIINQLLFSGSFYTTIALAFERLNAMKLRPLAPPGRSSPLKVK